MLGRTHKRIAKEIAKKLKLKEREAELLQIGSVSPDNWANFPHHHGKREEKIRNIVEARKLFLENDDECYHNLGVALHYIQDKWTLRPRTGDKHTKWERAIDTAGILDDLGIQEKIRSLPFPTKAEDACLSFLKLLKTGIEGENDEFRVCECASFYGIGAKVIHFALSNRPTTWSNPVLDLNFAYRICIEVARYVIEPWKEELTNTLEQEKEAFRQQLIENKRKSRTLENRIKKMEGRLDDFPCSYSTPNKIHRLKTLDTINIMPSKVTCLGSVVMIFN